MSDNAFDYLANLDQIEREYSMRTDSWLVDTFLNTSAAPRNNRPWFDQCIAKTFDSVGKGSPIVIGITGIAGSGKDSAVGHIYDWEGGACGIRADKIAFADPLKDIAKKFGFSHGQLYGSRELKEKEDEFWGISPRTFLQMVGTEMFRKVWRDDVWVKLAEQRIRQLSLKEEAVEQECDQTSVRVKLRAIFVTDVRFPNEAQMIKDIGGYIIRVERPDNPNHISEKHDSERFVASLPVDLTIVNDCANAEEWSWKFAKNLTQFFNPRAFY